jgi:hypothetical protein
VMHPNLSLFGLYSDDHELSMAHARATTTTSRAVHAPLLDCRPPCPHHRHRRSGREIERVAAAGSGRSSCGPAEPTTATTTPCGRRQATACRALPHPDGWREGQRPGLHDPKVVMESRRRSTSR